MSGQIILKTYSVCFTFDPHGDRFHQDVRRVQATDAYDAEKRFHAENGKGSRTWYQIDAVALAS